MVVESKFKTKVHTAPNRRSKVVGHVYPGETWKINRSRTIAGVLWLPYGNIGWLVAKRKGVETTRIVG